MVTLTDTLKFADVVVREVQLHHSGHRLQASHTTEGILLQIEALQVDQWIEILDLSQAIPFKPQTLHSRVFF